MSRPSTFWRYRGLNNNVDGPPLEAAMALIESACERARCTSPACGGGRRARLRNSAPERGGWGKVSPLDQYALRRHPHPNPPPHAGEGAHFCRRYDLDLIPSSARLTLTMAIVGPRPARTHWRLHPAATSLSAPEPARDHLFEDLAADRLVGQIRRMPPPAEIGRASCRERV